MNNRQQKAKNLSIHTLHDQKMNNQQQKAKNYLITIWHTTSRTKNEQSKTKPKFLLNKQLTV